MTDEIEVNEAGGMQSKVISRLDLFPARAWLRVGNVLDEGARKYEEENWRLIPSQSHLNHALIHLANLKIGDTTEDHAGHAACRIMMWLEMLIVESEAE